MIKNSYFFLLTFLVSIQISYLTASENINMDKTQKLIAHWSFDNIDNNKIKDIAGNHDATLIGKKDGFIQKGVYGNAGFFDRGATTLVISHSDNLSLTDNFSVECIIKPFKVKDYNTIIWKGFRGVTRGISPARINYYVDIRDGKVELKTKNKLGEWTVFSTRESVIDINKWYHIIITYKNGVVKIYVNGKNCKVGIFEKKPLTKTLLPNKDKVMIGVGANADMSPSYFFIGLIDDIKIYKGIVNISKIKEEDFLTKSIQNEITESQDKAIKIIKCFSKLKELAEYDFDSINNIHKICINTIKSFDMTYQNLDKQLASLEYKNYYISSFGGKKPFALTTLPSYKRLVKKNRFFKDIKTISHEIFLSFAKNEYEGFQAILLGNPFIDIKDIQIQTENLKHEDGKHIIGTKNIKFGPIGDIKTFIPEMYVEFTGRIPDPIMEGEKIKLNKNDFTPVFIRIYADKNTIPGDYTGKIKFSYEGYSQEINLHIHIYNFILPVTNSFIVAFPFFECFYRRWYGYKKLSDTQKMKIYDFLCKYRMPPCNVFSKANCYPPIKFLKQLEKKGVRFCTINSRVPVEQISKKVCSLKPTIEKLKKLGFYKNAYFYSFDELSVHMQEYNKAKALLPAIRKAYPDLKCVQTSFPIPKLLPLFNVWCPKFFHFSEKRDLEILSKLSRKSNIELWWCNADFPRHPYPNYYLDYPVFDCRIVMTLSYMYKVKAILYWCINREWKNNLGNGKRWPQVPWKPYFFDVMTGERKYTNGMGNFTYPGKNGKIYPSLRLENFRDGIEDYEYYKLLEREIANAKQSNIDNELIEKASRLLKVPSNVATAVNHYSPNPENLIKYREQIANMIIRLKNLNTANTTIY